MPSSPLSCVSVESPTVISTSLRYDSSTRRYAPWERRESPFTEASPGVTPSYASRPRSPAVRFVVAPSRNIIISTNVGRFVRGVREGTMFIEAPPRVGGGHAHTARGRMGTRVKVGRFPGRPGRVSPVANRSAPIPAARLSGRPVSGSSDASLAGSDLTRWTRPTRVFGEPERWIAVDPAALAPSGV